MGRRELRREPERDTDGRRIEMNVTYELHALSKNRWNIERLYDGQQKEKAFVDARLLHAEPHIQAVKLVRETYNESTNSYNEMVIFDTTKNKTGHEPAAAYVITRPTKPEPKPAPKTQAGIARHTKAKLNKMGPSPTVLAFVGGAAVLVLLGLWFLLANGADLLDSVAFDFATPSMSDDFDKMTDDNLAMSADERVRGQGAVVESMIRLKKAIVGQQRATNTLTWAIVILTALIAVFTLILPLQAFKLWSEAR